MSGEHKKKIGAGNEGGKRSDEAKKNMSIAQTGRIVSDETKKKMSMVNTWKILSEEHKKKIGAAHKGKTMSDECKKKLAESQRKAFMERLQKMCYGIRDFDADPIGEEEIRCGYGVNVGKQCERTKGRRVFEKHGFCLIYYQSLLF
jgi:hypothetical protein